MAPAEVASQAASVAQGLPNWLQNFIGSAVFIVVGAAGVLGYTRTTWRKAVADWKHDDPDKQVLPANQTTVAATFDLSLFKTLPEAINRIEGHIEYQNAILDDIKDLLKEAGHEAERAKDRLERAQDRAQDRNADMLSRLVEELRRGRQ